MQNHVATETLTASVVPIRSARYIMRPLLGGLCLALLSSPTYAQDWVSLEQLTVPAEVLPDGCRLAPRGGLPFSPRESNPVISRDSIDILMLNMWVSGQAGWGNIEADSMRMFEEWTAEMIEAAYSATYLDQDDNDFYVYAVLFKEPIGRQEIGGPLADMFIMKESILINAEAGPIQAMLPGPFHRSCYDSIRGFLEKVSIDEIGHTQRGSFREVQR